MSKQYEMLFKLGAQLGTDFNGTFSSAQKIISQTQKEIQTLNKEQNSIKAFEKQSNDVKKAQDAYNDYQAKLRNVREEMANASNVTADMKNKEIDLERAVANAAMKLGEKQAKLDALGNELHKAGVNTEDLAGESKRLSAEMDDLKKAEEEAAEEAEDFGNKGEEAFENIGEALIAAGILEGLKAVGEAYLECVDVSAQFAYQMSGVQAVSGASAADMELLSQKAKQMGVNTKFTASESGEALEYMAMAGWKTEDMLGGLEGIMYLAAAANEELGLTSDIVTDALTAFGLKASDSGHFADVLAQASSSANTNVAMMGQTFKYAAPLAGALGYTIEDVAIAAGLMANSGIKAEQAGTALRAMFTRLSAPPKEAEEALKQLGISIENADGTAKPLRDTIAELTVAFSGLSDVEQTAYASSIAGQNAMSGFLALVNAAPEDVSRLTTAVDNANGAAERMANVRLDNLAGQTELFNSALDATKMTIGEAFAPELEALTKAATEILNKINEFLVKHPEVTRAILAFVGTIGAVTAAYVTYKGVVATVKVAQDLLNISMNANPIGLVLTGIGALYAGMIAYATSTSKAVTASEKINDELEETKNALRAAEQEFGKTSKQANELREQYVTLAAESKKVAEAEKYLAENSERTKEAIKAAKEEHDSATLAFQDEELYAMSLANSYDILTSKASLTAAEQERLKFVVQELNKQYADLGITVDETTGKTNLSAEAVKRKILAEKERKQMEADIEKQIANDENIARLDEEIDAEQTIANTWYSEYQKANVEYQKWLDENPDANDRQRTAKKNTFGVSGAWVSYNKANQRIDELNSERQALVDNNAELQTSVDAYFDELNGKATTVYDNLEDAVKSLSEAYYDAYDAAYKSIVGQYELWDTAAVVIPKDIDDISTAMDTQIAYWNDYYTDLANLTSRTDIEGLDTFVAKFADGSEDSVNMIAALAGATDTEIQAIIDKSNELDEIQSKAASGVADLETGLTSGIVSEFESMIDGLDLDEESAAAAKSTVDAYIEQLITGETRAQEAANGIRNAVQSALWISRDPIRQHYLNGGYDGYADGTTNASPGWHLVGEEGPELVMFGGGERVLDAGETRNALGGTSVSISVPVTVYGNTDDSTARDIGDSVVERVLDALREAGVDARRNAYA